ncbi:Apocarotenoid-15,15'-oxygenase [Tetrabaena socialis]|uniref:Apocarotenoid-15,15'-oxygenase n=1 Tax=Tetrabaena socialis TaxID=47790 RepID=A0A2J8ACZ4_9CHLO|nr:Apocarotenoid-15,15'-oxygenase [Tetrabaena socialis]|eukprot:PNH10394.1 Apocarotenoid-15,15'-oxygenase [Tetrabaena socialis]
MNPRTLETVRETRMGGQIRGNTFAAHYRIVTEGPAEAEAAKAQRRAPASGPAAAGATAAAAAATAGAGSSADAAAGGQQQQQQQQQRRRLVTFSNEFGFGGARAVFYEFDEAGRLMHETEHVLPGVDIAIIHDLLVTEHYYVLMVGPIKMQAAKFATQYLFGRCSIAECLVYEPAQRTRIMLFPRPGRPSGKVLPPRVLDADPCFVFHNVNGYEAEGGEVLVLDAVAWDSVDFEMGLYDKRSSKTDGFEGGGRTQLVRMTADLRSGRVAKRQLLRRTVEFPAIDARVTSRPHGVAWFIADAVDHAVLWAPAQSVVRVETDPALGLGPRAAASLASTQQQGQQQQGLEPPRKAAGGSTGAAAGTSAGVAVDEWFLGDRTFPGEPMFVPRPGSTREGDGWLLLGVHNAAGEGAEGKVHIFDAEALSRGPLATLHLPHRLPVSLHGAWTPEYMAPDPDAPRWQELGSARPM